VTPIDLKARFGKRYRITLDPAHAAEYGEGSRKDDPWLITIHCRYGHIYPYGGELLGASTERRGPVARRLADLSCVRVVQDGDDGVNVVFHVDDFNTVARNLKPRRRRQLTPEQIAERTDRLRKYRFPPASKRSSEPLGRDLVASRT
jgi:hypothetical protein